MMTFSILFWVLLRIRNLTRVVMRKGQSNGYANEIFTRSSGHELREQ